jgi:hypothetical protein
MVLGLICERMLELRGGHLPADCELKLLLTMPRGIVVLGQWALGAVAMPSRQLLHRRLNDNWRVCGGDILDRILNFVLEMRCGLLSAELKLRILHQLRCTYLLCD